MSSSYYNTIINNTSLLLFLTLSIAIQLFTCKPFTNLLLTSLFAQLNVSLQYKGGGPQRVLFQPLGTQG